MTVINSVLGPIDTADMGTTLMHEHIMSSSIGIPQNYPDILDRGYMKRIVDGLKQAKAGGIDSVVDATTLDLGRDMQRSESGCFKKLSISLRRVRGRIKSGWDSMCSSSQP